MLFIKDLSKGDALLKSMTFFDDKGSMLGHSNHHEKEGHVPQIGLQLNPLTTTLRNLWPSSSQKKSGKMGNSVGSLLL